jgi:phosphoesterase RecJ-like protein
MSKGEQKIPDESAWWLMFGFCTDTGFFRHLESGSAPYFAAISRLLEYGISPKDIFMKMYGGKHPTSRIIIGKILSRATFSCEGRLCMCAEKRSDREGYGQEVRDSDSLYQLLLTVRDVEIIIYLREEDDGSVSGGIRTRNIVDAGKLAAEFGGGGHIRAAGFSTKMVLEQALEVLRKAAEKLLATDTF